MAVNVTSAISPVPAARPSMPSVRFTPFVAPAMITNASAYHAHERSISRFGGITICVPMS